MSNTRALEHVKSVSEMVFRSIKIRIESHDGKPYEMRNGVTDGRREA